MGFNPVYGVNPAYGVQRRVTLDWDSTHSRNGYVEPVKGVLRVGEGIGPAVEG